MAKTIKNIRLKHYDYTSDGFYYITICSNYRKSFSEKIREIIIEHVHRMENIADGIKVDFCELVSNHLHLILILDECKMSLGEIIRRFKAKTTLAVTRLLAKNNFKLWQPNYYEHVIRTEKALQKIREYIKNNPLKEKIDLDEIYGNDADKSATTK